MLELFRHGQTDWNVEGKRQGWNDEADLTSLGELQSLAIADVIPTLGIKTLYCSDLRRALDTLNIWKKAGALEGVTVIYDDRLRERNFGIFEGKTELEITRYWSSYHHPQVLSVDKWNQKIPEGESYSDFYARVNDWHKTVQTRNPDGSENVVGVLAHEGTNKMLWFIRNGAQAQHRDLFYRLKQPNQGMVWLV